MEITNSATMVGMAVATMVFSTAAMKVAIRQAARTAVRRSDVEKSPRLAGCASPKLLPYLLISASNRSV
jgi:hypothetical protein